jgi:gliding motility-associated-like protein
MKRTVPLCPILGVLLIPFTLRAQQANFRTPDSICENVPIIVSNTTVGAANFAWNFGAPDLDSTPDAVNLGGFCPDPSFMDYVEEGGKYYGFLITSQPAGLVELSFGNSLANMPAYTYLGNIDGTIPEKGEGIQMIKNDGEWYAIITGGDHITGPRIVKLDMGSSLASIKPAGTNWGNIGGLLAFPHKLQLIQIDGVWYGFTVNYEGNTITEFNFGTSFAHPPTAVNMPNITGLSVPTGFSIVQQDGNWYMFVTDEGNNTLVRLDFGPSLLNPNPTEVKLGNPNGTLFGPRGISIINFCNQLEGLIVNDQTSDAVLLKFPDGITGAPVARSLGNLGSMHYPVSISSFFSVASNLYAFILNVKNNSVSRLTFKSCNSANLPGSNLQVPPAFSYSSPGIYNINLLTDLGMVTQSSYCKTIKVLPPFVIPLPRDTTFCGTGLLQCKDMAGAIYQWSTGSDSSATTITASGIYRLKVTTGAFCTSTADVQCTFLPLPQVDLGDDTAICLSSPFILNAGNQPEGYTYKWQDGSTGSTYSVSAQGLYTVAASAAGCTRTDSVFIRIISPPYFSLGGDRPILPGDVIYLKPNVDSLSYTWGNGTSDAVLQVTEPGTYYVTGSNICGSYRDSVTIYKGMPLRVPNTFTPNGDGMNEQFKVLGAEEVDHFEMDIYSRWGTKVFESQDRAQGWDGRVNGVPLPVGAYAYQVHFRYSNSGKYCQIRGTVALMR